MPVRVFHWALVLLVIAQFVIASIGGNAMQFHAFGGYAILALVLFRILWGFLGGAHARFLAFVRGPGPVIRCMARRVAAWLQCRDRLLRGQDLMRR